MNLHGIVRGVIPAVTPDISVVLSTSTGFTTDPNEGYAQIPAYSSAQVTAQVQPLTSKDLKQVDSTNQNGEMRGIYLFGVSHGVARSLEKGGDILTWQDEDGQYSEWLVTSVAEQWNTGWVKVIATRQNKTAP